jgi:hypothetical protein
MSAYSAIPSLIGIALKLPMQPRSRASPRRLRVFQVTNNGLHTLSLRFRIEMELSHLLFLILEGRLDAVCTRQRTI